MWFFYLVAAITSTIGIGAFISSDSEHRAMSAIRLNEPAVNATQAAQITRSLRRLHQLDPTVFPALPTPEGDTLSKIQPHLISASANGGVSIPTGVDFWINEHGVIFSRIDSSETDSEADIFTSEIGRIGPNPSEDMNRKR